MTKALSNKRRVYFSPDNSVIVVEEGSIILKGPAGDKLKSGVAV